MNGRFNKPVRRHVKVMLAVIVSIQTNNVAEQMDLNISHALAVNGIPWKHAPQISRMHLQHVMQSPDAVLYVRI